MIIWFVPWKWTLFVISKFKHLIFHVDPLHKAKFLVKLVITQDPEVTLKMSEIIVGDAIDAIAKLFWPSVHCCCRL